MITSDLPLFNHVAPAHNGTGTSQQAALSMQPHANRVAQMVYKAIRQMPGGLTCEQVQDILGMNSGTVTARINELANCTPAFITKAKDTDGHWIRRPNRSGRNAYVWFATEEL
jgi:hypothetical protein